MEFYKVLICSPLICNIVLDKYRVAGKEKIETNQACLLFCTTEKLVGAMAVPAVVLQEGR